MMHQLPYHSFFFSPTDTGAGDGPSEQKSDASVEKYRTELEKEVQERTAELKATREMLLATLDGSLYIIQVFKAVRDDEGNIIDFVCTVNNKRAIEQNGDMIGKSLLYQNPGLVETGLFEKFVQVTETGIPLDHEQYYHHGQFNGWFHQTVVKMGDGFVMNAVDITERKMAEQEILRLKDEVAQKATDKYLSLFNIMEEGFVLIELIRDEAGRCKNYRYIEVNPAFEKYVGLQPNEVVGKTVLDLFPTLDESWLQIVCEVADKKQPCRFEHYLKENDSWYEVFVYAMWGEQVAVLYNNITGRTRSQEALRESESRFHILTDAIPQVIWTNDATGYANYFNQRWYEYSGLSFEQSAGLGWQAIVHPDDAPASIAKWTSALKKGDIFDTEYRLRKHDGSYCWFIGRNVPLKDDTGKVTGWFGSATDIEALKATTEALSQSEAGLKITMESATDYAIITTDTKRRIERWSNGASRIFGYTEAEVIGQSADIIFTEEDRAAGAPEAEVMVATDTGRAADERWHQRKDGTRFYMSGVMRPIFYNSELTGYVKVARDTTQQQLSTEELHRLVDERTIELQRSNEDLRQFAHVASHDLKEPVRKIQTFNNRILHDFNEILPDKVRTYLHKIGSAANRMYAMIDGVLAYSLIGNGKQLTEPVDLNRIMHDIITDLEVLIQQNNARISITQLPQISGYKVLLYQLFYNLILNSLKFSKADVPAEIMISGEEIVQQNEQFYRIIVSDNGIGFEQDYAATIFGTFTRLHTLEEYEGTGLGLALCRKIVDRHKGHISATGVVNGGATFTILLPFI